MNRIFIFANPISGRAQAKNAAGDLHARLLAEGFDVHVIFDPPQQFDPARFAPPCHAVIAIGGDGTVRAVAARLYAYGLTLAAQSPDLSPDDIARQIPPMLIVPQGTANLLNQHLGQRHRRFANAAQLVSCIRDCRAVEFDIAAANGSVFLLMAGIGFDAQIVHELASTRSGAITKLSYLQPAIKSLFHCDFPRLNVQVDGQTVFADEPAIAFVGNIAEYGTGFPMLPFATPDDRLLDVCVLPCANHAQLLRRFMEAAAGEHPWGENVLYLRGRRIHIDSPRPVPVQIDGDAAGATPLDIRLLPLRLRFIVPPR